MTEEEVLDLLKTKKNPKKLSITDQEFIKSRGSGIYRLNNRNTKYYAYSVNEKNKITDGTFLESCSLGLHEHYEFIQRID